ncbi:MAG TPA: hypothetical protein VFL59_11335 [Candidatus Nanopelagicales bacterium]|nr:hypothetical protein [Candidatus Nanopelagicales bacterium]
MPKVRSDDVPTGPVPVARGPAARRRSRRGRLLRTLLALVVVLGLAGLGLALVLKAGGGAGGIGLPLPSSSESDPLLPGAPTITVPPPAAPARVTGPGYDVSYPQCRSTLPAGAAFGIVGVNGGAPLTSNRCFAEQIAWAQRTGRYAVYINTSNSGAKDPVAYGRKLADDAIRRERAAGVSGIGVWWLDVELTNTWRGTQQENATVLAAMAARLQEAGVRVGIYSSPQQWQEIAGDWAPGLPVWNATGPGTQVAALRACTEEFAGSTTAIVQWVAAKGSRQLDHNLVCPAWRDRAGDLLDVTP